MAKCKTCGNRAKEGGDGMSEDVVLEVPAGEYVVQASGTPVVARSTSVEDAVAYAERYHARREWWRVVGTDGVVASWPEPEPEPESARKPARKRTPKQSKRS